MKAEVFEDFIDSGAILKGHFVLASGLHSDTYVQCAKLLQSPKKAERVASFLIRKLPQDLVAKIELVVAPAMGGLIIGHEIARLLNKDFIFFERVENVFTLKRGFKIKAGQNVLLVEDVITTGGSSLEVANKIKDLGANILAEAMLINRSGDKNLDKKLGFKTYSLLDLDIKTFKPDELPEILKKTDPKRLGSKKV